MGEESGPSFVPAFEGVLEPEQVVLEAHRGEERDLGPAIYHWPSPLAAYALALEEATGERVPAA